ncbi:MAG: hypothetical protein JW818_19320 [Pirellulales bacterium]|nr:hypothetical protein [Pirellulales bacterium]
MAKCVAITLAILLLSGCRGATTPSDPIQESVVGEYLVPREKLPPRIIELADSLERLPRNGTRSEFEDALVASGLNRKPDWFKDFQHLWYLDSDFHSETNPEKRKYVISIGYFPKEDSTIVTRDAGIHHAYNHEPWQETIWQIKWPPESLK